MVLSYVRELHIQGHVLYYSLIAYLLTCLYRKEVFSAIDYIRILDDRMW